MGTKSNIKIELVRSPEAFDDAMSVRRQVFVEEYNITKDEEFDKNDFCSAHIIAYDQKESHKFPVGTMRIRAFGNFVKFERISVLKDLRRTSVANDIMNYGFWYASCKGFHEVRGMCKRELLPRWQKCGYEEVKDVPSIKQNGMTLITIKRRLPRNPQASIILSSPELLIAPEGLWFDDTPNFRKEPSMIQNILNKKKQNS